MSAYPIEFIKKILEHNDPIGCLEELRKLGLSDEEIVSKVATHMIEKQNSLKVKDADTIEQRFLDELNLKRTIVDLFNRSMENPEYILKKGETEYPDIFYYLLAEKMIEPRDWMKFKGVNKKTQEEMERVNIRKRMLERTNVIENLLKEYPDKNWYVPSLLANPNLSFKTISILDKIFPHYFQDGLMDEQIRVDLWKRLFKNPSVSLRELKKILIEKIRMHGLKDDLQPLMMKDLKSTYALTSIFFYLNENKRIKITLHSVVNGIGPGYIPEYLTNRNLSLKTLKKYVNKTLWHLYSSNPNITLEFIKKNPIISWNNEYISRVIKLDSKTMDYLLHHKKKSKSYSKIFWENLCTNPTLTEDLIKEFDDDFTNALSLKNLWKNPNISWRFIQEHGFELILPSFIGNANTSMYDIFNEEPFKGYLKEWEEREELTDLVQRYFDGELSFDGMMQGVYHNNPDIVPEWLYSNPNLELQDIEVLSKTIPVDFAAISKNHFNKKIQEDLEEFK